MDTSAKYNRCVLPLLVWLSKQVSVTYSSFGQQTPAARQTPSQQPASSQPQQRGAITAADLASVLRYVGRCLHCLYPTADLLEQSYTHSLTFHPHVTASLCGRLKGILAVNVIGWVQEYWGT